MKYSIRQESRNLRTTEPFEGESIESKVKRVESTGAPVEAVSPMYYTERKDGVKPETNIRTDKWDVAQTAMESIAKGIRTKRAERMNAIQLNVDKPASGSEINEQKA